MSDTMDLLQAKLQTIFGALGGDPSIIPPPDCMDTLGWWLDMIIQQLADGTGGAVVPDNYFFADTDARDEYFLDHPDELKKDVLCCTESPVALWKWNGTEWKDSSTWVKGPKGDKGNNIELQNDGTYIQWRVAGASDWNNLVSLSSITGHDGDSVDLQVTEDYIQWKHSSDSQWQNLIALSLLKGADGISIIWKGDLSSPPSDPEVNWAYYDINQNTAFIWNGASWDILIQNQPTDIESLSPELIMDGQDYRRSIEFDGSDYAKKTDLLTPQEKQYLDELISSGALDRIYWSVIITTTQVGSITTDRVYLNIIPDTLTTSGNWKITHSDGSVLERDDKQITYTKDEVIVVLSDENGDVLEHKFHIPAGITVTEFDGNLSGDINNVFISVEFDIHSLHEIIGDTDSLTTTEKVVVNAINEIRERFSRINDEDRFINFDPDTGWNIGLTNDTHGGHIRLLDKEGTTFLDIDVAAYGSGLEAVFSIDFIGGEFDPANSYEQGDRVHHRKTVTLTGWPEVTECTLAYVAKVAISPGPWDESKWDLRNDSIAGRQVNTYTQIARDGFIFVAIHQMLWDHEPTLDEFTQDDWYLINRLPVVPGKFAIFMLDNSVGQVGWLAADELVPFTGTSTVGIDAQGNVSVILNPNGILEKTDAGLLLNWHLKDGVYTLGSDNNTKFYDKTALDTKFNGKQDIPTTQSANMIYAGPSNGAAAIPTFRKLSPEDMPKMAEYTVTSSTNITDLIANAASYAYVSVRITEEVTMTVIQLNGIFGNKTGSLNIPTDGKLLLTGTGSISNAKLRIVGNGLVDTAVDLTGMTGALNFANNSFIHMAGKFEGGANSISLSGGTKLTLDQFIFNTTGENGITTSSGSFIVVANNVTVNAVTNAFTNSYGFINFATGNFSTTAVNRVSVPLNAFGQAAPNFGTAANTYAQGNDSRFKYVYSGDLNQNNLQTVLDNIQYYSSVVLTLKEDITMTGPQFVSLFQYRKVRLSGYYTITVTGSGGLTIYEADVRMENLRIIFSELTGQLVLANQNFNLAGVVIEFLQSGGYINSYANSMILQNTTIKVNNTTTYNIKCNAGHITDANSFFLGSLTGVINFDNGIFSRANAFAYPSNFNTSTVYQANAVATYNGNIYMSLVASNQNHTPTEGTDDSFWHYLGALSPDHISNRKLALGYYAE
jgi:hypothetical protein